MELIDVVIKNTGEKLRLTFNSFAEFKNSRKFKDYQELLPAFSEHLGFELIVRPDETHKIGEADGKHIFVYEDWGTNTFFFSFFHELAHNLMHFENGKKIDRELNLMEKEADAFAAFFCCQLFPHHAEGFMKIAYDNPTVDNDTLHSKKDW